MTANKPKPPAKPNMVPPATKTSPAKKPAPALDPAPEPNAGVAAGAPAGGYAREPAPRPVAAPQSMSAPAEDKASRKREEQALEKEGLAYGKQAQGPAATQQQNASKQTGEAKKLHGQARKAASTNDCKQARALKGRIYKVDPTYYGKRVAHDPVLSRCEEPPAPKKQRSAQPSDVLETDLPARATDPAKK